MDDRKTVPTTRTYIWRIIGLMALALFLYPHPSTDFLYRHAQVLEGRISNLKGASKVLFLDPGFYYKFSIRPSDLAAAVSALVMKAWTMADFHVKLIEDHGPWLWNAWWWRPSYDPVARLYSGNLEGSNFYLLYDPYSRVAYLYIQNT